MQLKTLHMKSWLVSCNWRHLTVGTEDTLHEIMTWQLELKTISQNDNCLHSLMASHPWDQSPWRIPICDYKIMRNEISVCMNSIKPVNVHFIIITQHRNKDTCTNFYVIWFRRTRRMVHFTYMYMVTVEPHLSTHIRS